MDSHLLGFVCGALVPAMGTHNHHPSSSETSPPGVGPSGRRRRPPAIGVTRMTRGHSAQQSRAPFRYLLPQARFLPARWPALWPVYSTVWWARVVAGERLTHLHAVGHQEDGWSVIWHLTVVRRCAACRALADPAGQDEVCSSTALPSPAAPATAAVVDAIAIWPSPYRPSPSTRSSFCDEQDPLLAVAVRRRSVDVGRTALAPCPLHRSFAAIVLAGWCLAGTLHPVPPRFASAPAGWSTGNSPATPSPLRRFGVGTWSSANGDRVLLGCTRRS